MEKEVLDTTGLQCFEVLMSIWVKATWMETGDILEVVGDCPDFEDVVRQWCRRIGMLWLATKEDAENRTTIWIELWG